MLRGNAPCQSACTDSVILYTTVGQECAAEVCVITKKVKQKNSTPKSETVSSDMN